MTRFSPPRIRKAILDMAFSGATVHVACAFSIVEILTVLYRDHLVDEQFDRDAATRDLLVLSKGHGVMAQYACLYEAGVLQADDLANYFKDGTRLKGLADAHVPGVTATTGSLGHGLSVAVGLALAAKLDRSPRRCYTIVGDGELNEGSIWEAALFATQFKLDNLVVIVDKNGLQAMGSTDDVMTLGDLAKKFEAFGFDVSDVDGHDETALSRVFVDCAARPNGRPKAIVAHTVKGKGVSFMEHNNIWHYTRLNAETHACAVAEVESAGSANV